MVLDQDRDLAADSRAHVLRVADDVLAYRLAGGEDEARVQDLAEEAKEVVLDYGVRVAAR